MNRPDQKLWMQSPAVFCGMALMGLTALGGEIYLSSNTKTNELLDPTTVTENVRAGLRADLGSLCVVSGDPAVRELAKRLNLLVFKPNPDQTVALNKN